MKSRPAFQVLHSFFGLERRATVTRFLYAIVISVIVLDTIMIVLRAWDQSSVSPATSPALLVLLLLQFVLLFLVRRGYVDQAAYLLVIGSWVVVTYIIWSADGVRDVALYLYLAILLIAALITDWQLIFILALLSISFIWFLAIAEYQGLRPPHLDAPLSVARDLTVIFILLLILIYLMVNSVARSLDAVREGEKKFRKIFQVSPVAISIFTLADGILVDANDAFFDLTGYVRGDYARLLEVLQNLIDNACKFMGDQDSPHIEIGQRGDEADMPVFYVQDNGIGIQPQFHENIFGLFNKLDIHTEGTGVGLTLVKRIVEFHGGRIWVESEPGRGTTFFFSLPTPPQR